MLLYEDGKILTSSCHGNANASRPLLRCRPRAQCEVHELPLFVEKSRSCRVVQERALVQHEQVASKKNNLHEHTRALYVIATRRLCNDELKAMPLGRRCDAINYTVLNFGVSTTTGIVQIKGPTMVNSVCIIQSLYNIGWP